MMEDKTRRILLLVVIVAIVLAIYYFESTKASFGGSDTGEISEDENSAMTGLEEGGEEASLTDDVVVTQVGGQPQYQKAPELEGIVGYINTEEGLTLESLKGKVVLVDFWTYSCINCIRTLPYLVSWDEKYRDKGLVIIGVHTPEFNFEKDYDNVLEATEKYNIEYPVVQDNNYATWKAYENRFWPRKYLVDAEGYIRYDHIGEGGYEETEEKIQELLAEIGESSTDIALTQESSDISVGPMTPELYLGYNFALPRGQNIGNEGGLVIRTTHNYVLPETFETDIVYLGGNWQSNEDNIELVGDTGKIILNFRGKEAHIVADAQSAQDISVVVGESDPVTISVDKPDLYTLYSGNRISSQLEITVQKGFTANSFTFG